MFWKNQSGTEEEKQKAYFLDPAKAVSKEESQRVIFSTDGDSKQLVAVNPLETTKRYATGLTWYGHEKSKYTTEMWMRLTNSKRDNNPIFVERAEDSISGEFCSESILKILVEGEEEGEFGEKMTQITQSDSSISAGSFQFPVPTASVQEVKALVSKLLNANTDPDPSAAENDCKPCRRKVVAFFQRNQFVKDTAENVLIFIFFSKIFSLFFQ